VLATAPPAASPQRPPSRRSQSKPKNKAQTRPVTDDHITQKEVEDDKRRRNTAASARFRVKKKQREQAMEQKAKDLEEQMTTIRARIHELETENKWLKSLVLEKNESKPDVVSVLQSRHRGGNESIIGSDSG
jgi:hypothetical protein